ncbi:uncharacterized protein METZ01_LOCUS371453, partial [marine metagenome]
MAKIDLDGVVVFELYIAILGGLTIANF